jgi:DHA2 family multidrug resistance protein
MSAASTAEAVRPTPSAPVPAAGANAAAGPPKAAVFGFFAMVFGMFMAILDIQIVSSSLREIQAGLAASSDEIAWVQTSYLIAEVVMIPLSGMLSRVFSTRILFAVSCGTFTLASLLCSTAGSIGEMVAWRVLQGFLGGAMIPTVFATSFILFPPAKRAGVSVLIGLVATMAPTIGPTLGGWLTETFSWHWLFLANVPPGIIVTLLVWRTVDIDKPDLSLLKGFDWLGLLAMAAFLGGAEYVFDEGPRWDWLDDAAVRYAAIVAVTAGALFFWRVLSYRQPIVELRAFQDRNFAIGCVLSFVLGIGLYGSVYLLPLFLGSVRGYNALQIGQIMFVTGMFQFMSAPLAGFLSKKLEPRVMLALGLILFGVGVYLNHFVTNQSSLSELFLPQAIRGVSLMLCFLPINTLALGTLPPDKIKNASGLYNLMRNLGGAIGLAMINTVIDHRMAHHMRHLLDQITLSRNVVTQTLDAMSGRFGDLLTTDPDKAALRSLMGIVQREASVLTYADAFLLMSLVFFAALLLMPLVHKPRSAKPPADAH